MATAKKLTAKKAIPKKPVARRAVPKATAKTAVKKVAKPAVAKATKKPAAPKAVVKKAVTLAKAVKDVKDKKVVRKPTVTSELVKKYRASAKDTGSVAVQIALLTDRIKSLTKHLNKHIHDSDSKRGLLIAVGKRRRSLNYLRENHPNSYAKLIKDLKLKK